MKEKKATCCSNSLKKKLRSSEELRSLKNRLSRIEGQVRGLQNMLDDNAYCTDIMTQVSAAQSALKSFNIKLMESHLSSCVINDIRNGDDEVIADLLETIKKLI